MKKGKYANKGMRKSVALLLTMVLLLGVAIGGTVAWLTSQTDTVVNTFTTSNIGATLTETTGETYKMIPGWTIDKDPKASVTEGSEDAYLFVTVESNMPITEADGVYSVGKYLEYEIAAGWTKLENGVYYRTVMAGATDREFPVLKDNLVKVKDTVTKEMMDALTEATYPTLSFKAYAVQYKDSNTTNFEPAEAWALVKPNP